MQCAPDEQAQVDFGTGAPVITPEGKRRRTHVLRVALSHSRMAHSEAIYRQITDDFIRHLENAFCHFGGVPQTLVNDNLNAAGTKADWFDPELNPKVLERTTLLTGVKCLPNGEKVRLNATTPRQ